MTRPAVVRGFDRLAPAYDLLAGAAFAGRIHASQAQLLPRLPRARRALVVGGGTGRFLAALLAGGHAEHAVSIDVSPAMTRRTAARLARLGLSGRAELRVGGLERLAADERFDLVATHCFLDLFEAEEFGAVVTTLRGALAPDGAWLWSDFSDQGAGVPGLARRSIVAALYTFFRATCGIAARRLPDVTAAFAGSGLECVARAEAAGGLLRSAVYRAES